MNSEQQSGRPIPRNSSRSSVIQDGVQISRPIVNVPVPVEQDSPEYNMNHAQRGQALFFINVDPMTESAKTDVKNLEDMCRALGFKEEHIKLHYNEPKDKIVEFLSTFADDDHVEEDCVLLVFITKEDKMVFPDGVSLSDYQHESFIRSELDGSSCISLAGKPKLIFVQAYRADDGPVQQGHNESAKESEDKQPERDASIDPYTIPKSSDFLIVYSTSPRNTTEGSPFYRQLSEEIQKRTAEYDLYSHIVRATHSVVRQSLQDDVPNTTSTLLRDVFFLPKTEE